MRILSYFKENIGYFTPHETKGLVKIEYYNYTNLTNPFEPKGVNERAYYEIGLTENDILFINNLYDNIEPMKKYNENGVFLLSICIFLISRIIEKPLFKLLKLLEGL